MVVAVPKKCTSKAKLKRQKQVMLKKITLKKKKNLNYFSNYVNI